MKLRELVEWAKDQDPDLEIYTLTTCQCCTEEVPAQLETGAGDGNVKLTWAVGTPPKTVLLFGNYPESSGH